MYKSTVQIPFVLFKQVRTKHITFTIEFYNKLQNTEKKLTAPIYGYGAYKQLKYYCLGSCSNSGAAIRPSSERYTLNNLIWPIQPLFMH